MTEGADEIRANLDQFGRDWDYIVAHDRELLELYPEEWVGVQGGCVYHAPTLLDLLDGIRAGGHDPDRAARVFLTRDD